MRAINKLGPHPVARAAIYLAFVAGFLAAYYHASPLHVALIALTVACLAAAAVGTYLSQRNVTTATLWQAAAITAVIALAAAATLLLPPGVTAVLAAFWVLLAVWLIRR